MDRLHKTDGNESFEQRCADPREPDGSRWIFGRNEVRMSTTLDLTDLRLFLHIVEHGSITAGSRAAHLSLAAGSARMLGMEQALTTSLLVRGSRGALPTAAGLALAQHARTILDEAERLRIGLRDHVRGLKGFITLQGTSAAIREYLPNTLGDFLAKHPRVNVSAIEAAGDTAVRSVLEGSADIAIVTERASTKKLESFPFLTNRFALVVPRGHPLVREARGRAISITKSDVFDVVGLPSGTSLQDTWEQRAATRGATLNYRVRVPSFDAQMRLIERGVGVAMLPETAARRGALTMAIDVLPLSDVFLIRKLLICVRRFSELPPYTQSLVEHLRAAHRTPEASGVRQEAIDPGVS